MHMKQQIATILLLFCGLTAMAQQDRHVQHKPYIDLRPMHFGILVGMHLQDLEFDQVGPHMMEDEDGVMQERYVLCDADRWTAGFSVGVLGELRLSNNFSLRVTPTMHFGAKHLTLLNMKEKDETGQLARKTQDMIRLKRFNTMAEVGVGCDFYLPFFKLIPQLKFCFGLGDVLDKNHVNELRDANLRTYASSVSGAQSKMIVLTFYFE